MHRASFVKALLLSVLGLPATACPEQWPHEPFTPEAWQARIPEERYVLYDSLAEQRLLEGASHARVVELLGVPDGTSDDQKMIYLVRKRPMGTRGLQECQFLEIQFDGTGYVYDFFIRGT